MVDSQEIEQLRALAFASIPAAARKPQHALGVSSTEKGGTPEEEREEGELSSDDENAALAPASPSHLAVISASQCLSASNGAAKVKGRSSVSFEFCPPIAPDTAGSTAVVCEPINLSRPKLKGRSSIVFESCPPITVDTPGPAAVVCEPITLSRPQVTRDSNLQGSSSAVIGKRNGSKPSARTSAVKYRDRSSVLQHLLCASPSLPLRTGSGSWPVGGVRKEADAFLAGLNIPLIPNSCHLPAFPADPNNSLVIKFSDEDSDSDGEQHYQTNPCQAQTGRNGVENRTLTGTGLVKTNLSNQPTGGLKSEIDRVKKQIAAIERIKSKPGVSRVSKKSGKSTAMDVSKQDRSNARHFSKASSAQTIPVDLESLRQQIAAKESELQLRKQQGLKELTSAFAASDATHGSGHGMQNNLACSESSLCHSESEEMQDGAINAPVPSELGVYAVSVSLDYSSLKNVSMKEIQGLEPGGGSDKQSCSFSQRVAATVCPIIEIPIHGSPLESVETGTRAQPVECLSVHNSVDSIVCEKRQPSRLSIDGMNKITKISNVPSHTPKRKRVETESSKNSPTPIGERVKKHRRNESFKHPPSNVSLEDSLRKTIIQEHLEHDKVKMLMSGLNIKNHKVASDPLATEAALITNVGNENSRTACESIAGVNADCAVFQVAQVQNNGLGQNVPSNQTTRELKFAGQTPQRNDNNVKLNALKEGQICRDVAMPCNSYLSKAIIEMKGDSSQLLESEMDRRGIIAGPNSTGLNHPALTLEGDSQGLFEQGQEFGHDSVKQLQDEEDLIDKELEEAQQGRRRCEVREHLARRQYRDAQEALRSANLRCEILHQKREVLAARIKAAELQYLQTKAFLVSPAQPKDKTLVSLEFSKYPARTSLGFGTSFGVPGNQQFPKLPADHKLHLRNSLAENALANMKDFSETLQRMSQLDNHPEIASPVISELHCISSDAGSHGSHHSNENLDTQSNGAFGVNSSSGLVSQLETGLRPLVDGSSHHQVGVGEIQEHNRADVNIRFANEDWILSKSNEMEIISVLVEPHLGQDRSPRRPEIAINLSPSTSDSCGLNVSAAVPINTEGKTGQSVTLNANFVDSAHTCGLEECSHGFSSASYARDLGRNANNNIPGPKDAIVNDRIHQFELEGECISNQIYSSHYVEPQSIVNFDTNHSDHQTLTLETETGPGCLELAGRNLECSSKAFHNVPITDSDYNKKSGACLPEREDIDQISVEVSQFQHFDDAKRRDVLYDNKEAAVTWNDCSKGQGFGILTKLQDADTGSDDDDDDEIIERKQDVITAAKENSIQSMELCTEGFLAKELGCTRVDISGVGLQIDLPDDSQPLVNLDSLGPRGIGHCKLSPVLFPHPSYKAESNQVSISSVSEQQIIGNSSDCCSPLAAQNEISVVEICMDDQKPKRETRGLLNGALDICESQEDIIFKSMSESKSIKGLKHYRTRKGVVYSEEEMHVSVM